MIAFILSRILQAIPVILTVGLIAFCLFMFVGDPVLIMLGNQFDEAQRLRMVEELGLNDPFYVQYGRYLWDAIQGNFGISYRAAIPVTELLGRSLPASIELVAVSLVMALGIGIPLGIYTAIRRDSWLSHLTMTVSLVGISLPTFVVGIFLVLIFSVTLGWLPSFGRGELARIGGWTTGLLTLSGWRAILLPAVTIALFQITFIMRLVRAEMLSVLRADYIKFARARGIRARSIHFRHALRNTLIPVITVVGLQIGGLMSFAMVTESVFQWPGMGLLLINSINFVDIPVMAAFLMLIAVVFLVINLVVDLLYFAVDPRLRGALRGGAA